MFQGCVKVYQGSFKHVSRELQGFLTEFQGYFKEVQRMFGGRFMDVSQGSFKDVVSRKFQGHFKELSWGFKEY